MGRIITSIQIHKIKKRKKNSENLSKWKATNEPYYYGEIPTYLQKIYTAINIQLKSKCNALIPDELGLPNFIISEEHFENLKQFVLNHPKYEKKFKDLPLLLNDLLISERYNMYYLHIPESGAEWFLESRFFSLVEITANKGMRINYSKIEKFAKDKYNQDIYEYLEEWMGTFFNISAEYLIFTLKKSPIFFSCETCFRGALLIKSKNSNDKFENNSNEQKIWGTINIVDALIYSCANLYGFSNKLNDNISKNNIIYYNDSLNEKVNESFEMIDSLRNKTFGAFILVENEFSMKLVMEELKRKDTKSIFNLIMSGTNIDNIIEIINEKFIDRVCIFSSSSKKYDSLKNKYPIIKGIFSEEKEIEDFINAEKQDGPIYESVKLLTYNDYSLRYNILHKKISHYYENNTEDSFNSAISILQDFLYWSPELNIQSEKNEKELSKIELLLKSLQQFKDISSNEEEIIRVYTKEFGSFYQDFNKWLYTLDPLSYEKISWFIAGIMYSLDNYSIKKGITIPVKLYRGIKMSYIDLSSYKRCEGQLVTFPSFTSTSADQSIAEQYSYRLMDLQEKKNMGIFSVIIIIDYKFKDGFIPNAIDVSDISDSKIEKERIFPPFSFFKINKVNIDYENYIADIYIDSIGRKEILEKKLKEDKNLFYNEEGFMEAK